MTKVLVFGAFDPLHEGHLNFFKQAKKYGDYLVVIVARNINIERMKGHLPQFDEMDRKLFVEKSKMADKVFLGKRDNPFQSIIDQDPDVICLGYDQVSFTDGLEKKFPKIRIVKLKPYKPEIYKSSKLK